MKEHSKASERGLSDEEIANLSDGEFKALVIKMFTDLIELGRKMKKQMKDTQNEIKQNIQGTNSDRKEARTQNNDLEQNKKNKLPSRRKGRNKNSKKNEEKLRNLWANLKCSDIQIIWVPEGEQKQEVENLFEKNNEGELPKSDEGNSLPRSPGSPENPEEVGPKEAHTKEHHH